jgi:hypothetical protein
MLTLRKPERSLETLRALAGSGSSRFARPAQAELRERMNKALAACLGEQRAATGEGSR